MDKRVILAVAGAGKTYTICNDLDSKKNNLILAFTRQNVDNIKAELEKKYIIIPNSVKIMTFHSFVYQMVVLPYFPSFLKKYNSDGLKLEGVTFKEPPPPTFTKNGYRIKNINYYKVDNIKHYVEKKQIYCSLMTTLCNKDKKVLKRAIGNLSQFFDMIYIDEFQDFRNEDYKFISYVSRNVDNICLVGDFFQHSVSGTNNSGQPFKNGKNFTLYEDYLMMLKKEKFMVDNTRLKYSRRCSKSICEFVQKKLKISVVSSEMNLGNIIWVNEENIDAVLQNDSIVKLVEKGSSQYIFNCINWGYSKGDTYSQICVILTGALENMNSYDFVFSGSPISRNKLYVALTRTKGDLYIMKKSIFDKKKCNYYVG